MSFDLAVGNVIESLLPKRSLAGEAMKIFGCTVQCLTFDGQLTLLCLAA